MGARDDINPRGHQPKGNRKDQVANRRERSVVKSSEEERSIEFDIDGGEEVL